MKSHIPGLAMLVTALILVGSASIATAQPSASVRGPSDQPPTPSNRQVDATIATRLKSVMVPLLRAMNRPIPLDEVEVGLMDDPHINAANAGGGHFYVTTGLLEKANDDQLRAVVAHEVAHADLGHVAKAQRLGAGLTIGMVLLDQVLPGSRALTPIAGRLIQSSYGRREEYQADAHGVEILDRAGYDGPALMAETLTWLTQVAEGSGRGGFFSTHPATADRITAVRRLQTRAPR
jgi:beta-barrel assembly-enhancing protease